MTRTAAMVGVLDGMRKPLIGMVHLAPLPGSVRSALPLAGVVRLAVQEAGTLADGGCDAVMVENYGDAPFAKRIGPETIAALALATREVVGAVRVPVGVNALRNDAPAALAIAHAADARFFRCNVWSGSAWTDQGLVEGCARETLDLRRRLGAQVEALTDAHVKHASHPTSLEQALHDNERNLCDAHIVTGARTGGAAEPADLALAKRTARKPVLVGSGITAGNIGSFRDADGFIVGTSLQRDGRVDAKLVEELVRARNALR
ncbi:MAG: BtpA/SgcQ family protein [Halobacteriales archaeon]|nr:BtpA/SgcQ family protein [Halobacteriales archaeon]